MPRWTNRAEFDEMLTSMTRPQGISEELAETCLAAEFGYPVESNGMIAGPRGPLRFFVMEKLNEVEFDVDVQAVVQKWAKIVKAAR